MFLTIVGLLISGITVSGITATLASIYGVPAVTATAAGAVALPFAVIGIGGVAYQSWKIYTNRELLIIIKRILVDYKITFDENQPGLSHKPRLDQLFVDCVKEIIVELYEREIFANGKLHEAKFVLLLKERL
jgi:hypothetical protein